MFIVIYFILLSRVIRDGNTHVDDRNRHRPLRFFRSEDKFKFYGTKLSYTRCREILKQTLKELGYDEKKYIQRRIQTVAKVA